MFKKLAEVVVCGAIGAAALYLVGRIAYQAGQDVAREECRYAALQKENQKQNEANVSEQQKANETRPESTALMVTDEAPVPVRRTKQSKLGLLFGAKRMFGNRKTVLGHLVKNPEDHKFEAYVEGDELQIHVRRKEAS